MEIRCSYYHTRIAAVAFTNLNGLWSQAIRISEGPLYYESACGAMGQPIRTAVGISEKIHADIAYLPISRVLYVWEFNHIVFNCSLSRECQQ